MKAVCMLTDEEATVLVREYKALKAKVEGVPMNELLLNLKRKTGYAHYEYSGTVSYVLEKKLGRMPTGTELIMLVDSGFSHFGATCSIDGHNFRGRVNTD